MIIPTTAKRAEAGVEFQSVCPRCPVQGNTMVSAHSWCSFVITAPRPARKTPNAMCVLPPSTAAASDSSPQRAQLVGGMKLFGCDVTIPGVKTLGTALKPCPRPSLMT